MAPKGGNAKKEGGRAKKAENEVCSHVIPSVLVQPPTIRLDSTALVLARISRWAIL